MSSNDSEKDTARPRFYKEAVQNAAKSAQEGRPIFEEKEMVEVRIPGDRAFVHVAIVDESHRNRWPEQYEAFKRGEERAASGTPLEQWPLLTRSRVAELKAANIFSVEEYANVADGYLQKLGMHARTEREQARAYLASAKDGAVNSAMAAEIARLTAIVEALQANAGGAAAQLKEPPKEKSLEECSDDELKEFIKRESGQAVKGNPSRKTLLERAAELATDKAA